MSVQDLVSYSKKIGLYPISLEDFAASENFYKLYRSPECKLTFIYNTVTCSVAVYNGENTDSLILEVHNKHTRFLQRDIQRLVNIIFETHQGV